MLIEWAVKENQVKYLNDNLHGSKLKGRTKNRWWNCAQTGINKCKITNWKER